MGCPALALRQPMVAALGSPLLLRHLFGATRVWAQLGLRGPRGERTGRPPEKNLVSQNLAENEAVISSRLWRFEAGN